MPNQCCLTWVQMAQANSDSCHQVSLPNLLTLTFGDGFNQSLDNVNLDKIVENEEHIMLAIKKYTRIDPKLHGKVSAITAIY